MQCVLTFPLSLYLKLVIFYFWASSGKKQYNSYLLFMLLFIFDCVVCTVVYVVVLFVFLFSFIVVWLHIH